MRRLLPLLAVLLLASLLLAKPTPESPDPNMVRPIESLDTVFIEEMTWMEVRDAMKAGKKTVIIATGGVEQNGPYLATGKHNYILRATTEAIARKLGNGPGRSDCRLRPRRRHRPAHRPHEVSGHHHA